MTGWSFTIKKQSSKKRIAFWGADIGGLDWFDKLVEEKKAICRLEGYYPSLYTVQAKYILPVLQEGPPEVKWGFKLVEEKQKGWRRWFSWFYPKKWTCGEKKYYISISQDEIATCDPDEWLSIEIWDLS